MVRDLVWAKQFLAVLALAGIAQVSAATPSFAKENCEQYQSPFQYNECLSRQAPGQAHRTSRTTGTGGADPEATVPARRRGTAAAGSSRGGLALQRSSRGRVRAVIDPWAGTRSATTARKRRR